MWRLSVILTKSTKKLMVCRPALLSDGEKNRFKIQRTNGIFVNALCRCQAHISPVCSRAFASTIIDSMDSNNERKWLCLLLESIHNNLLLVVTGKFTSSTALDCFAKSRTDPAIEHDEGWLLKIQIRLLNWFPRRPRFLFRRRELELDTH